ncbi:MAG: hypothetical protein M3O50_02395 [Myxococcota bacterium]|nr:hypothetical protein [Myxococcota bacterium]
MRRPDFGVALLAIGLGTAFVARDAHALGPVDVEVAGKAGVGTNPGGSPGPLGFGLGARAGVSLLGLYGGLAFMYYFGESDSITSVKALTYGLEGGFGSKLLGLVTLRGTVGIGNYTETVDTKVLNVSSSHSSSSLYIEPGVTGLVTLGPLLVGADANILILPSRTRIDLRSSTDVAFTMHGQIGVVF